MGGCLSTGPTPNTSAPSARVSVCSNVPSSVGSAHTSARVTDDVSVRVYSNEFPESGSLGNAPESDQGEGDGRICFHGASGRLLALAWEATS